MKYNKSGRVRLKNLFLNESLLFFRTETPQFIYDSYVLLLENT